MTEVSPQEWGNRYRAIRGTCESLTARLRALVVDLLAEANLEVIQIEARTKAIDSFADVTTIAQLDKYLRAEIFPTSIAGTAIFRGDGAGIEDALTLLIMADQRVARDIYGKVYSGDWAQFAAKADTWHGRKRWQRAG